MKTVAETGDKSKKLNEKKGGGDKSTERKHSPPQ
jgi:hypothetical protein